MMNKWWLLVVFVLCWVGAGLAMFSDRQTQGGPAVGAVGAVNRIVSTAPNITEILFELGLGEKIVGVTILSNYPAKAAEKPKIGTFWQPNVEAVIAADPDLVVTVGFPQQVALAERLSRIGYNSLTVDIEKVDQLFSAIEEIGKVTHTKDRAQRMVADIKNNLDGLAGAVGDDEKVRVLWIVQRQPLMVAGRKTFVNEMIELAGGENVIGQTLHKYPPLGAEQVIACRADVIIEAAMQPEDLAGQQEAARQYWSKFKNVPAVKNGRVYVIDGDLVSRPGPRLYEATEMIAKILRPELILKPGFSR